MHFARSCPGIVNATGCLLANIDPYDLIYKNYKAALWFKAVMEKGMLVGIVTERDLRILPSETLRVNKVCSR